MTPPRDPQPRHVRDRVRYQAHLDAETHAKLEERAAAFHRKRSAILRHAMPWGLTQTRGWTVDRAVPGTVRTVGMLLEPELLQQVQAAAAAHGATVAAWVCHTLQPVTIADFSERWRLGVAGVRSHESGYDQRRFMLRLDDETSKRLDTLTRGFDRPAAEVIRQLIVQATPVDFPPSWQVRPRADR